MAGRRIDATRNAERLLAAARELFDEVGPDVALDEVARRAGVGNATLYRNFPTRGDLLVAAYADEVAELCARGDAPTTADPADALFDWLGEFVTHVATKRDLAYAATSGDHRTERFDQWHAAMHRTAAGLVDRALRAGTLRPDADAADLLALASGVALAGGTTGSARRLLDLVRHGVEVPSG
ncbi:TetR family transcriptional regulator [Actinocatenispora thailandica]|uniref:TetR family transcriptional regulator n=1 Tax=Actinocatenispora thailandica TaxID=227318 RepID=A0A7R7HYL8_9ACTN|nr:TetR/AcrR family transcriptional regulator [Actinocatenispora thailandica]BCJ37432.1 TetR family transcriptional regulator [Actinocatenispora thailandica]